jgi:magnesium chelatase subunit I
VPGLLGSLGSLGVRAADPPPVVAAAAEFVLEGLYAHKKIGRSEDGGFVAVEASLDMNLDLERLERMRRIKRQVN